MRSSTAIVVRSLANRAARLVLGMVTGVLIARTLQPEGRGIYAVIATTAGAAIVVGHLSLEKSQIALWVDRSRHRSLIANGLILGVLLGSVSALGALLLISVIGSPGGFTLWGLALFAVPFGAAAINLNGVLLLQARLDDLNRKTLLCALVQCVPILVLAAVGQVTITSVIICWALSTALPFVLAVRALRPIDLRWDTGLMRRQLSLSSRYHVGWVGLYFIVTIDILLLNAMDSPATVGLYTVAVTILALTYIPGETITQIVLPRQAAGEVQDAQQITARAFRLNLLIASTFVALLAGVSPWLIPVVYGQAFAGSVAPLLALAPGTVAMTLVRPLEQYLVRLERPSTMTAISVCALTTNVLLNLAMIPRWGAVGAALASSAAYILMTFLEMTRFTRSTGTPMRELLPRPADLRSVVKPLVAKRASAPTA